MKLYCAILFLLVCGVMAAQENNKVKDSVIYRYEPRWYNITPKDTLQFKKVKPMPKKDKKPVKQPTGYTEICLNGDKKIPSKERDLFYLSRRYSPNNLPISSSYK